MLHEDILEEAVLKFGQDAQLEMIIEECAELIHAIQKFKRNACKETLDHVVEELADVEIMIDQSKFLFDQKDILDVRKRKIYRLRQRIADYDAKRQKAN